MPARNVVKEYKEDGIYHVYNRGVEKRVIFNDRKDSAVFLSFLKKYLSKPEDEGISQTSDYSEIVQVAELNFYGEIELLAYCLMPNHFHLLLRQTKVDSMQRFMRALGTKYSMYFNKRFKREGSLFQGIYRAILVESDDYLVHLTRYIHLNPKEFTKSKADKICNDFTSYPDYIGKKNTEWLHPELILGIFVENGGTNMDKYSSYESFVQEYDGDSKNILGRIAID